MSILRFRGGMGLDPDGPWVHYDDHRAEVDRLTDATDDRAFWDAAMIAVASGLAAREAYVGQFPTGLVIDAGIVADALLEERRARWGEAAADGGTR